MSRLVLVWYGWLVGLWHGRLLYGLFRLGWRGSVGFVRASYGAAGSGMVWLASYG